MADPHLRALLTEDTTTISQFGLTLSDPAIDTLIVSYALHRLTANRDRLWVLPVASDLVPKSERDISCK